MKTKLLLLIGIFCGIVFLQAESEEESISPLMMLRGVEKKASEEKQGSVLNNEERDRNLGRDSVNLIDNIDSISSLQQRGGFHSISEPEVDRTKINKSENVLNKSSLKQSDEEFVIAHKKSDLLMNSSLQLCKAIQEHLDPTFLYLIPEAKAFFMRRFNTDEECQLLHQKLEARLEKEHPEIFYSGEFGERGAGESNRQITSNIESFLRALFEEVGAPLFYLTEEKENLSTGTKEESEEEIAQTLLSIPLPQGDQAVSIQSLLKNNLSFTREEASSSSKPTSYSVKQSFSDPLPPSLTIFLDRKSGAGERSTTSIDNFKQQIMISTVSGKKTTYEPEVIICQDQTGEYSCYRKKEGRWLLFEDEKSEGRFLASGSQFVAQHCCVISYRKLSQNKSFEEMMRKNAWKEEIDMHDFGTIPNGAIFWTGYLQGNLRRAQEYGKKTERKTLELTEGGQWLQGHELYNPDSFYSNTDADSLWRYVSEKFVHGATGHVLAFVLEKRDPRTIYHGTEKPILLRNPQVFLSEYIHREEVADFLAKRQKALLQNYEPEIRSVLNYFKQAEELWNNIATIARFKKDRVTFLEESLRSKITDNGRKALEQLDPSLLKNYLQRVHSMLETWEGIVQVVSHLAKGETDQAKRAHQLQVHEGLNKAQGIESLEEWKPHYNWLHHATQTINYYIFDQYREKNQEEQAVEWRTRCRELEEERLEPMGESRGIEKQIKLNLIQAIEKEQQIEKTSSTLQGIEAAWQDFLQECGEAAPNKTPFEKAREADAEAWGEKRNQREKNFEKEIHSYRSAQHLWQVAFETYKKLESFFEEEPACSEALKKCLSSLKLNSAYWAKEALWGEARKIEADIAKAGPLTRASGERAELAWGNVVIDTEQLLQEPPSFSSYQRLVTDLNKELQEARSRKEEWTKKIVNLNEVEEQVGFNSEIQERAFAKKRIRAQRAELATRKAIAQYQRMFNDWSLPGLLIEEYEREAYSFSNLALPEEEILPGKISDETLERIGKTLIEKERKTKNHDKARLEIDFLSQQPSKENQMRWEAKAKAKRLFDEVIKIATQKKDSNMPKMMKAPKVNRIMEEEGTVIGMFPKNLSVIGSTIIGAPTKITAAAFPEIELTEEEDTAKRDLANATAAAQAAEKEWKELLRQAEERRLAGGGEELDFDQALYYWEEADKEALLEHEARGKLQQEEETARQHQNSWEVNQRRLRARLEADQASQKIADATKTLESLYEKKSSINATKEGRRSIASKENDQEIKRIDKALKVAREEAEKAERRWEALALEHHLILKSKVKSGEKEKKDQLALNKLKKADQAAVELWYEISKQHEEEESLFKPVEEETEKNNSVNKIEKTTLLEKQTRLIEEIFEGFGEKWNEAKKTYEQAYEKGGGSQVKSLLQAISENLDQEGIKLVEQYSQKMQEEALEMAKEYVKKKREGALEAWEELIKHSEREKAAQEEAVAKAPPARDPWADEAQREWKLISAIAEANKKAARLFEEEKKRLSDLGQLWRGIISAKKRKGYEERDQAAKAYAQGEKESWEKLSSQDRYLHDIEVQESNENFKERERKALEQALEEAKVARANVRLTRGDKLVIDTAREAHQKLLKREIDINDRTRAIEIAKWSLHPSEEREKELKQKINSLREMNLSTSLEKTYQEEALEYWEEASKANQREEYERVLLLKEAAEQMEAALHYEQQAIHSEQSDHHESAELWHATAKESETLGKKYKEIFNILDSNKSKHDKKENISKIDLDIQKNAAYLKESADYLRNARMAEEKGEADLAETWREIAQETQLLFKYETAVNSWVEHIGEDTVKRWNKLEEDLNVYTKLESSACLKKSIEYLKESTQVKEKEIALLCKEAAQRASSTAQECYQAEQAILKGQSDNYKEVDSLLFSLKEIDFLVLLTHFKRVEKDAKERGSLSEEKEWKDGIQEIEAVLKTTITEGKLCINNRNSKIEDNRVSNSWYGAIKSKEEKIKLIPKIIETEKNNKLDECLKWRELMNVYEKSYEYMIESTEAYALGKIGEGESWNDAFKACYNAALKQVEAIKAEQTGKIEEAVQWRKAAEIQERLTQYFIKSAKDRAAGKVKGRGSWYDAGDALTGAAFKQEEAIKAEQAGKTEEAVQWKKAAEIQERSTQYFIKGAEARAAGKIEESQSWYNAAEGWYLSALKQEKAIKAEQTGKIEEAVQWRKAAEIREHSTQYFIKGAEARAARKMDEGESWSHAGLGLTQAAEKQEEAIKAEQAGKTEEAVQWRKTAEKYEHSTQYFIKGAEARAARKMDEGESWSHAGLGLTQAAEKQEEAIKAERAGKREEAEQWKKAGEIQERLTQYFIKGAKARAAGKMEEGQSWHNAGLGWYWSAEKQVEAIKAEQAGKREKAAKYREAAEIQERSTQYYIKAAEARALGKMEEGQSWYKAGEGCYNAAEKQEEAIKAEQAGKIEEAAQWKKAAEILPRSAQYYIKAAEARAAGKMEEGQSWHNAGDACYNAAPKQVEAIKAEQAGKIEEAIQWKKAVEIQERSSQYYIKVAEARALGKMEEGESWHSAGQGWYWSAVKQVEAIKAEQAGKIEEAVQWRKAAEIQERSTQYFIKGAEARAARKMEEGQSWYAAGRGCYLAAFNQVEAIEAEKAGKREEAVQWKKAAEIQERSAQYYIKEAEARALGKMEEGKSWHDAGDACYDAALKQQEAIKAERAGKTEEAVQWREAASLIERSIEPFIKSAQAYAAEKKEEAETWYRIGKSFSWSGDALEQSFKAKVNGQLDLSKAWQEVLSLKKKSVDFYTQAIKAYEEGKKELAQSWHCIGLSFYFGGVKFGNAIQAEQDGNLALAQGLREAATLQQQAADHYVQAVQSRSTGDMEEGEYWHQVGRGIYEAAEQLEKATKVEQDNKPEVASLWRKAAEQFKLASTYYRSAVTAFETKAVIFQKIIRQKIDRCVAEGKAAFEEAERLTQEANNL